MTNRKLTKKTQEKPTPQTLQELIDQSPWLLTQRLDVLEAVRRAPPRIALLSSKTVGTPTVF